MDWNILKDAEQLDELDRLSGHRPVLIYKHSTRCGISSTVLSRLERKWQEQDSAVLTPYFLDLLRYRELSNLIAERYGIEHQSPQVLLIEKGQTVYAESHMQITYDDLMKAAG